MQWVTYKSKENENNEKNISQLKDINNCTELEDFSKSYGTAESGSLGSINYSELPENLQKEIKNLDVRMD